MINQILFKRIDKKFGSALQSVWMSHITRIWALNLEDVILVSKVIWILLIIYMESPY